MLKKHLQRRRPQTEKRLRSQLRSNYEKCNQESSEKDEPSQEDCFSWFEETTYAQEGHEKEVVCHVVLVQKDKPKLTK